MGPDPIRYKVKPRCSYRILSIGNTTSYVDMYVLYLSFTPLISGTLSTICISTRTVLELWHDRKKITKITKG